MNNKIKVRAFLPVGVCGCSLTSFLGNIYQAIRKYHDVIDYYEDTATSERAVQAGVRRQGVLVGSQYLEGTVPTAKIESAILAELSMSD